MRTPRAPLCSGAGVPWLWEGGLFPRSTRPAAHCSVRTVASPPPQALPQTPGSRFTELWASVRLCPSEVDGGPPHPLPSPLVSVCLSLVVATQWPNIQWVPEATLGLWGPWGACFGWAGAEGSQGAYYTSAWVSDQFPSLLNRQGRRLHPGRSASGQQLLLALPCLLNSIPCPSPGLFEALSWASRCGLFPRPLGMFTPSYLLQELEGPPPLQAASCGVSVPHPL